MRRLNNKWQGIEGACNNFISIIIIAMKVKELIEKLKEVDWELEVIVNNTYQDEVDECQYYLEEEEPKICIYNWRVELN